MRAETIEQATLSEDFTFPAVTDHKSLYQLQFSGPASSFWYGPSALLDQSKLSKERDYGSDQETHQRRSFSFFEGGTRALSSSRDLDFSRHGCSYSDTASIAEFDNEEEKMDMLWEDFHNYDQLGQACLDRKEMECSTKGVSLEKSVCSELEAERPEMAELCCVQALKMPKSSRPGLLVMLKVLKKLFLLHNSHYPKRR